MTRSIENIQIKGKKFKNKTWKIHKRSMRHVKHYITEDPEREERIWQKQYLNLS